MPVRWAALLTVALLAAGCLSPEDGAPPTQAGEAVADLEAPGAQAERMGRSLAFTWTGELGAGAEVPLVNGALLAQYARAGLELPVDQTVATVELALEGSATAVARLRDSDGHLVCVVRSGRTCATEVAANASARWPLEVISLAPDGVAYTLTATLGADPPVLGDDGILARGHVVHRSGVEGGEPTLAVAEDGRAIVVAGTRVLRLDPLGGAFTDVTPPLEDALSQTLDPFLYGDVETGRVYLTQLAQCMRLSWTDDLGDSWLQQPVVCAGPEQHHQKVTTASSPVPGQAAVHVATMNLATWLTTEDVVVFHSRSLDGGLTWAQNPAMVKEVHGLEARAIGNIAAAYGTGTVHAVAYLCDRFVDAEYEGVAVGRSTDQGATWDWQAIAPGGGRCEGIDPGIWAPDDGQVYAAWEDISAGVGHVWFASSQDAGLTWSVPRAIPTGGLGSFAFTDVTAADGRVAVAFLATPDTTLGPTQAPGWARWYPYVATWRPAEGSDPSQGAGWRVARLQEDPVQLGPICMDGPKCLDGARNLLDFIDLRLGPQQRVYTAYADGCEGDCAAPWQSRDAFVHIAIEQDEP